MSECKHSFNLSYGKYCKICGLSIVDAWNLDVSNLEKERDELQAWIKNLQGNIEELSIEKLELQAQVAVLRKGMEVIADTTSHKRAVQLAIRFVATTPAEAVERVQKLVEALEGIEQSGAGTLEGVVVLTQEAKLARQALAEWRKNQ